MNHKTQGQKPAAETTTDQEGRARTDGRHQSSGPDGRRSRPRADRDRVFSEFDSSAGDAIVDAT
jgi:hypothetical protein